MLDACFYDKKNGCVIRQLSVSEQKTDEGIPMTSYFRFIALLAVKIFSVGQVK